MKKWLQMLLISLCALILTQACAPEAEQVSDVQGDEEGEQESSGGVLPRNIDDYVLGDSFEPGASFRVDDSTGVFMFNEVEGVTYRSIPDPDAGEDQPVYTISTINGRIFKIKKSKPIEFREADETLARYLTMYGKALDNENRPESEADLHWINFSEERTFLRIEFLVGTLSIELSAYDLKP